MANRFTQFVRTDYQALPVDYYQAALSAKEAQTQAKVDDMKAVVDYAGNIEAMLNPDIELKQNLLADLDGKIAELAQKNLSTPDALMQLQNIVGDRERISNLVGIQKNTENYRTYLENRKKYVEEYGNDINADVYDSQIAEYNKLGKDGFKSNFLNGATISKYVDINGELQKVLEKMKPQKLEQVTPQGDWLYKVGNETLTMKELMEVAALQLKDPKYATQLQLLNNYNLRRWGGGDINKGATVRRDYEVALIDEKTKELQSQLANYKPDSKEYKELQSAIATLGDTREELSGLNGNALTAFAAENQLKDLTLMSASPFVINNRTMDLKENPFAILRLKYSLADQNKAREQARKFKYDKDKLALQWKHEEEQNAVVPQQKTVILGKDNAGNVTATAQGFIIGEASGFKPENVRSTITSILNSNANYFNDRNVSQALNTNTRQKILKYFTGTGDFGKMGTVVYIPKTEEYQIETPEGIYRVQADHATTSDMKPLKTIYDAKPGTMQAVVSLDGKGLHEVVVSKRTKDDMSFYVPTDKYEPLDRRNIKEAVKKIKANTGFDLNESQVRNMKDGAYIIFQQKETDIFSGSNYGKLETKILPIDEYERLRETEEITPGDGYTLLQVNSKGDIRPLQQYGATMADVNKTHIMHSANQGGALYNLKDKHKTTKTQGGISSSIGNGGGYSYSGPTDEGEDTDE